MGQEPENHFLYSDRSACYTSLHRFDDALADAKESIREWVSSHHSFHLHCPQPLTLQGKGYGSAARAYRCLGNFRESMASYSKGLEKEPGR